MKKLYESYSWYTKLIFHQRAVILGLSLAATLFMGYHALQVRPDTRLERLIPASHAFVQNAREFLGSHKVGASSVIRVAVARADGGSVFDYKYLLTLQKISDELSLLDGVDTQSLNSLWAPSMLWFSVTSEGYESGPIIDYDNFSDTAESMDSIRNNVIRAGIVGSYVSNDFTASMIDFMVMPYSAATRKQIDMGTFADQLDAVRTKYETRGVNIHIIGDLKKISDIVDGFSKIVLFFLGAICITTVLLFQYSRCIKCTLASLGCSIVAVIWQLGALHLLGCNLGVFSVLVPFLIFAIGISHGVQIINALVHETANGKNRLEAAMATFHHLHGPGMVALLSDGIGFAMLFIIDIGAIRDLSQVASIGVAVVIFTNLMLLPVLLSYTGVTQGCIRYARRKLGGKSVFWSFIAGFTGKPMAYRTLLAASLLLAAGLVTGRNLKIGDLDKGAPELRADSIYNVDNVFITTHFATSTDVMGIFAGTPEGKSETHKVMDLIDRLGWILQNTEGVKSVASPASRAKDNRFFSNEGNLKLWALPRDRRVLSRCITMTGTTNNETAGARNMQKITLELTDHCRDTLDRVVAVIRSFAKQHDDTDIWFRLGDGNAAYEAATNEVIKSAQYQILFYVYGVVLVMVLLTFRSWRAVVCILTPLALTSVLANGLMALLGIGIKVATLPVIALGVGIGVDYGIYIYSRLASFLKMGHSLRSAYEEALKTTGRAVCFTGITLALGVATWHFSPIKFQADMGILLTFMFLFNMLGALTFLPSLAYFFTKYNPEGEAYNNSIQRTLQKTH